MDLVPVYEFSVDNINFWPSGRQCPMVDKPAYKYWHAVPKPWKHELAKSNNSFITSYAPLERYIIHDLNNFKALIRIFKKMRDTQGKSLNNLKSFYIQTIFMHYLNELNEENIASKFNEPIHELFYIVSTCTSIKLNYLILRSNNICIDLIVGKF